MRRRKVAVSASENLEQGKASRRPEMEFHVWGGNEPCGAERKEV